MKKECVQNVSGKCLMSFLQTLQKENGVEFVFAFIKPSNVSCTKTESKRLFYKNLKPLKFGCKVKLK